MNRQRLLLGALLVLAAAGCSDTADQITAAKVNRQTVDGPTQALIDQLFPRPGLRQAASAQLANVEKALGTGNTADAEAAAAGLLAFATTHFEGGRLLDPNGDAPPTSAEALAQFGCELQKELSPAAALPDCATFGSNAGDALDNGGAVGIIGATGGTLVTPNGQQGISVPAGATDIPRVFLIDPILATAPRFGPLPQPRCIAQGCEPVDQFPLFSEFSVSPAEPVGQPDFNVPVTVGLCHLDPADGEFAPPTTTVEQRLRIGHALQLVNGGEELQVLARTDAPFLDCADLNSGTLPTGPVPQLGLWNPAVDQLAKLVRPVFAALLPKPAYGSSMAACCLGGLATKLSPFGAVDPGVPLTPQDPAQEGQVQSSNSDVTTEILFTNLTADSVHVYWLDENGQRRTYTDLGPGRSYLQQTFVGHKWIIASMDELGLAIFEAIDQRGHAEFTGPAGIGITLPPPQPVIQ